MLLGDYDALYYNISVHSIADIGAIPCNVICVLLDDWCRSQWPRDLRRRSAAARLLRLWVRIPPGDMNVCLLRVLCIVR